MNTQKRGLQQFFIGFLAIFCVFSIFFGATTPANAYELLGCRWPTKSIAYHIGIDCLYEPDAEAAWETAIDDWGNACSINFLYNNSSYNCLDVVYEEDSKHLGDTYSNYNTETNAYIYFVSVLNLAHDELEVGTIRRSVANHELGHAIGLADDNTPLLRAIMNQTRKRILIYKPQDDDIQGVNAIYG